MKKFLIITGIIAILLAGLTIRAWLNISVTAQEAMEIAVAHVGGGIAATPELDWEISRPWSPLWWWVEVWHEGLVHEIYIHPSTGVVMGHEIDRD